LEAVLRYQGGVIRRDQATAGGISAPKIAGLVRRGRWQRVLPRVFAADVDPLHAQVRVRAAWLWAGEDAVIGGNAAAWWLGIEPEIPLSIDVLVPPARRMTAQPGIRLARSLVGSTERISRKGLLVTSPERTCLDLARKGVEDRMESALRLRKTTPQQLELSLEAGRGRRGQVMARQSVAEVLLNPWSKPERLAHRLLLNAGIVGWRANPSIPVHRGVFVPDVVFDDLKLILEIDGHAHHGSPEAFDADRLRQNQLVEAGWTVLRFPASHITAKPGDFVRTVQRTIARLSAQHSQ